MMMIKRQMTTNYPPNYPNNFIAPISDLSLIILNTYRLQNLIPITDFFLPLPD